MKRTFVVLLAAVTFWAWPITVTVSLVPLVSCGSLNQSTYRATGVATVTVDKAMSAWGDYVARFHPGPAAESKVKDAYENYQRSINTVADTAIAYLKAKSANDPNTPAAQASFNNAIAASSAALADLETLIVSFGVKL